MRVKPSSKYTHGFFLPHVKKAYQKYAGVLLPQPYITTQEQQFLLLDEVLGDGFTLLKYCETAQESRELDALIQDDVWQGIRIMAVGLHLAKHQQEIPLQETHMRHGSITEDTLEQPLSLLLSNPRLCLLVRPDRYMLGIFAIDDVKESATILKRVLRDGE